MLPMTTFGSQATYADVPSNKMPMRSSRSDAASDTGIHSGDGYCCSGTGVGSVTSFREGTGLPDELHTPGDRIPTDECERFRSRFGVKPSAIGPPALRLRFGAMARAESLLSTLQMSEQSEMGSGLFALK